MSKLIKFFKNFSLITGYNETDYVISKTFLGCGKVTLKTSAAVKLFTEAQYPLRDMNGLQGFYCVFGTVF